MYIDSILTSMKGLYGNHYVVANIFIFLMLATITDIKSFKIPNKLNLAFLISRFALIPLIGFSLYDIVGAIMAFVVLIIPAMIKMHKMGGDIKCMTVVGLFLGAYVTPVFIALSCIYGLIYGVGKFLILKKCEKMPFAPFFLISHITIFIYVLLT